MKNNKRSTIKFALWMMFPIGVGILLASSLFVNLKDINLKKLVRPELSTASVEQLTKKE